MSDLLEKEKFIEKIRNTDITKARDPLVRDDLILDLIDMCVVKINYLQERIERLENKEDRDNE